ncbi:condensation domain-containing protein, partial [Acidobacterium sp. S8]|uniref:condensation domain-containing protein n=1 Tax=Acidobacterium sp. S8 TaxID=1641854 RepID=UPI0020B1218B
MKPLIQFLSELRGRDVALNVHGDKLTISAPKNAFTPEMRQELADRKQEILTFLRNTQDWKGSQQNARDSGDVLLSRSQQRVWFLDQVRPANPANNIVIPFWLTGMVDLAALDRALRTVVERHESLRTGFSQRNGQAFAWIAESVEWKVDLVDLRELGQREAEEEAKRLGWHAGRRSFELNKPPLFRATMFQVSQDRYLLVMVVHHIVADGWSLGILSHELTELYREFSSGRTSPLPEPQFQYRDYVHWEREEGRRLAEQQMPYWLDRLGGDLQTLEIPTDRPRSASLSSDGGKMIVEIDEKFAEHLRKLSREISTTLFNVLLAAFKVLLFRYTASEDVLVGSNVANRPRQEFSTQIGFFVNNVLLRTQLSGNPTFVELVRRVTETTRTAYANQNVPFDMIVEKLRPERGLGNHSPLAQIMFTLENLPLPELRLAGLTAELAHIDFNIAGADLAVLIWPVGGGYRCEFEYSTDLFEEETIGQMQGHYVRLLEEVVKDGERRIGELPLLSAGEREEVLRGWNQTSRGRAGYRTVAEWFG